MSQHLSDVRRLGPLETESQIGSIAVRNMHIRKQSLLLRHSCDTPSYFSKAVHKLVKNFKQPARCHGRVCLSVFMLSGVTDIMVHRAQEELQSGNDPSDDEDRYGLLKMLSYRSGESELIAA